ncbi:MAG: hypothetical protein C6Y22_30400 [Hapalosiphonaceae cyanobacterium JJU2]|nr:MAG: hypothetical protein C6Y22_30400 [Hapalosiphonaceae cyanobacterium JJU2]
MLKLFLALFYPEGASRTWTASDKPLCVYVAVSKIPLQEEFNDMHNKFADQDSRGDRNRDREVIRWAIAL